MNSREKPLFSRLQDCLNAMSGLGPSNPADLRAKIMAYETLVAASSELMFAVSCIGFGDYEDAGERLARAESLLGMPTK